MKVLNKYILKGDIIMITEIRETVKANKGKIIKRAILIGAAALGLAIVAKVVISKRNSDSENGSDGADEVEDQENLDGTEEVI